MHVTRNWAAVASVGLVGLLLPAAAVAQSRSTGTPPIEIGGRIGVSRIVGTGHAGALNAAADVTVWTRSGLGFNVAVEYSRETTPPPTVVRTRLTMVPVLGHVVCRIAGNRTFLYAGVGGGLYVVRMKTAAPGGINLDPSAMRDTALGAHGLVGVESPLAGRARVVFQARFGFVRFAPKYSFNYSLGIVAASAGVRF